MELKRGYFITFEGADGCGKTTQAKLLVEWLNKKQLNNIFTFEPGATDLGKSLRQILLHYDKPVANAAESFLYLADRAQHVQGVIKPALLENKIVICDRFVDSTLAYQGFARGEDIEKINFLNKIATSGIAPDLTIVFDIESEIAQRRLGKKKDRLESEGITFHKKVREGYLKLAQSEPQRIKVINANNSIEEIFEQVKKLVGELLNL